MRIKKVVFYASILLLLLSGFWWARHRYDVKTDKQISGEALPKQDKEELIIDGAHHKLITVARQPNRLGQPGSIVRKSIFLPPHAKIEVGNDGIIKVDSRTWGTESSPQFGFAYSDKARVYVGEGVFYVTRWELVPFVSVGLSKVDLRLGLAVSYNVYSNTRLFIGVQTNGTPTGGISFSF